MGIFLFLFAFEVNGEEMGDKYVEECLINEKKIIASHTSASFPSTRPTKRIHPKISLVGLISLHCTQFSSSSSSSSSTLLPRFSFMADCKLNNFENDLEILDSHFSYSHRFHVWCCVLLCFVLFSFLLFCFVLFCFVLFCFLFFCYVIGAIEKRKKEKKRKGKKQKKVNVKNWENFIKKEIK